MSGSLGKSKSGQTSRSTQDVWGEQTPYLQNLYSQAGGLLESRDPRAEQAMQMQQAYAQSPELQRTIGGTQQALQSALDPSQSNPYLAQATQRAINPLTQAYQENVLSGITDQAVGAGQSGSSRQGIAEGIAGREYLKQVGDVAGQMAYQDYGAGRDRMMQAIPQAAGVANLGMMPSGIMRDVGQQDWQDLARYQQMIGAPTKVGESVGSGFGRSFNISGGIGG